MGDAALVVASVDDRAVRQHVVFGNHAARSDRAAVCWKLRITVDLLTFLEDYWLFFFFFKFVQIFTDLRSLFEVGLHLYRVVVADRFRAHNALHLEYVFVADSHGLATGIAENQDFFFEK